MENKAKEVTFEEFPKVFKSSNGTDCFVTIIYRDHSETYKRISVANDASLKAQDPTLHYDPYSEEDMERGNGGQQVHCNKETKIIRLTSPTTTNEAKVDKGQAIRDTIESVNEDD